MFRAAERGGRPARRLDAIVLLSWVAACALALDAGCSRPPKQLVVVVDSDLAVPAEVTSVRARVRPLEATDAREPHTFALAGDGSVTLPFSFGVVPPGGDASRRVELEVEALDAAGEVVVTRRVRTGFLRDQSLRVPIFLAASCRDVVCAPDSSCDRGACVPAELAPETLVPVTPGQELLDGGAADARRDDGGVGSCTPVPTTPWIPLVSSPGVVALTVREGARPEWVAAAEDTERLYVHAIGLDGTGDREIGAVTVNRDATRWIELHPLPDPDDVLAVRMMAGGVVEMRRSLMRTGTPPTWELVSDSVTSPLPGLRVLSTLDGAPVLLLDELTAGRPSALFRLPTSGLLTSILPVDLGTTTLAYRGAIASRGDGSLLVGRAALNACEVMPVSRAGVAGSFASFRLGSPCSAPEMAELADGRVGLLSTYDPLVAMVLAADLSRVEATRDLGPLTRAGGHLVPVADGSLRVVWSEDDGVHTVRLAADAALTPGEELVLTAPGATPSDYAQVRAVRRGTATAMVFGAPDALMRTVLCD